MIPMSFVGVEIKCCSFNCEIHIFVNKRVCLKFTRSQRLRQERVKLKEENEELQLAQVTGTVYCVYYHCIWWLKVNPGDWMSLQCNYSLFQEKEKRGKRERPREGSLGEFAKLSPRLPSLFRFVSTIQTIRDPGTG